MNGRMHTGLRQVIPHIVAFVVIALCVNLALWQADRATEKEALLSDWDDAASISLTTAEIGELERYARISAQGVFDRERQVLLDNQVRNMRAGVHVFTPFQPVGSDRIWMVNRGWQPMPQRGVFPEFNTPAGMNDIVGRLSDPPRVGIQIGSAESLDPDNWPNLMTYFELEQIREVFGPDLQDQVILLDPDHPAHLSGDEWQPVIFGPERHRAYAFQWTTIAIAVLIIWVTLTIRSYRRT